MKTIISILCLFAIILTGASFAQTKTTETMTTKDSMMDGVRTTITTTISETDDITPRNNMFSVSPVKYILFYNLTYFRKLSDRWAIGAGVSIPTFGGKIDNQTTISGFGANIEGRYYPDANAPRGFYIAPNIYYNTLSITDGGDDQFLWTTAGILLGYQFFPTKDFSVGCGVGIDYLIPSETFNGNSEDFSNSPFPRFVPALRFDIGYAWR